MTATGRPRAGLYRERLERFPHQRAATLPCGQSDQRDACLTLAVQGDVGNARVQHQARRRCFLHCACVSPNKCPNAPMASDVPFTSKTVIRHRSGLGCSGTARVLSLRIGTQPESYQAQHWFLMQIPGVDWVAASIIAEIGTDVDVFASAPAGRMGRGRAGQLRKRGQAEGRRHALRQRVPQIRAVRRRLGRSADQGQLLPRQVQPPARTPWPGAGDHGHRPQAAHRRVPHAEHGRGLPQPRRRRPRPGRPQALHDQAGPAPEQPGLRCHACPKGSVLFCLPIRGLFPQRCQCSSGPSRRVRAAARSVPIPVQAGARA